MVPDKDKQGQYNDKVSAADNFELRNIAAHFHITIKRVRKAIEEVGNSRKDIEEFLDRTR